MEKVGVRMNAVSHLIDTSTVGEREGGGRAD
jgi:hypothetical protein